jgi:hypothetical protein
VERYCKSDTSAPARELCGGSYAGGRCRRESAFGGKADIRICAAVWFLIIKIFGELTLVITQDLHPRNVVMPERRRVQRTQVFKGAKIFWGQSVSDCIVRDVTNLGCCVSLISTTHIPDRFELTFDAGRTLRPCRAAWRTGVQIGAEF